MNHDINKERKVVFLLLKTSYKFYNEVIKKSNWNWNNELQEKYYDFMKNKAFLTGDAKRKDKDTREKTSGLVDIGLITEDRLITEAGKELLKITSSGDFGTNNVFNINRDSFIYLKQLLKTSIDVKLDRLLRL